MSTLASRAPQRGAAPVWTVHAPPADTAWAATTPGWLVELRRFRAEVLHSDGLRPAFRGPDGAFRDDDPADPFGYHVVARIDGRPIATLRVVPLARTRTGFCERMFGTAAVEAALAAVEVARETTWEGSGWAVEPSRRGAAMGTRVLAAGSAVARELGLRTAIGASGRRYGQLYRILSAGYRRADGVAPVLSDSLVDEVQLVHGTLDELRPSFQALVERAADLLQWQEISPTRLNTMTS